MKMKRLLTIAFLLFFSAVCFAQNNVTQFLGIPIDGTKSAMIQKLKAKGFTYDAANDVLEGEFNGQQVQVYVVTENNKVYRICVFDKNETSESQIKIRFNKLCHQFENNKKYLSLKDHQEIDESEDISYEITVHNKEYQAGFLQVGSDGIASYFDKSEDAIEQLAKKMVWFTISERYGNYSILMYYDNENNKANGEDL